MAEFLDFIQNNVSAFWVVVIFTFFAFTAIVIIVYTQGREFKAGPIHIGAIKKPPPAQGVSQEQLEDIAQRTAARANEIREELNEAPAWNVYQPAKLPESTIEIFKAKTDIENRLRKIVGTGFAGGSINDGEYFFSLAKQNMIINKQTVDDIESFYWLIRPYIYGNEIREDEFNEIKYLVIGIIMQLETARKNR